MASARSASLWRGSGGGAPSEVQGQSPWSGRDQGGEAPWSWNTFCFWMFDENRKFAHFSEIRKRKRRWNIVEFCNSCWKMAKNTPFHIKSRAKNFHGRAKGGPSHRAPPLNTPLYLCIRRLVKNIYYPSSWTHQLSIILSVQVCYRTYVRLLEWRSVRFIGLLLTVIYICCINCMKFGQLILRKVI